MRVAVVGTCASGKTSVVAALRERGIDAYAVAQEHSAIHDLWRHQEPDRVVVLDTSLESVRRRRNDETWPAWIYDIQQERLAHARANAHLIVQTDDLDIEQVTELIVERLGIEVG